MVFPLGRGLIIIDCIKRPLNGIRLLVGADEGLHGGDE